MKDKIESSIQTIFEIPAEGKKALPPQITLTIKYTTSLEFIQGLNNNRTDESELLFDIFSKELEKLRNESSNHRQP